MKLYNTLSRKIEELKPVSPPKVTIYTCGPTVYDYPHIGNWFTFIRYDLLIRTLRASGFQPKWVLNITDVGHLISDADEGEDKIVKGARREGKSAWEVANFYTDYFQKGLRRLNFSRPEHLPRATQHIQDQIELIKKLEAKGYTYKIDDGIYYDTSKFPKYADFAQLDLDEQQVGDRVNHNPQKRSPADFALWKFSPTGRKRDMEWDSPWGRGFPGWHLECSAMALKYLGETIDIHSGGIDHIPVHHTNEIAQSEAVTGKPLAKHWMHTNHILADDQKISKSKGAGITLDDIENKGFSLQAFRLLVLQSHYRTQSKFSWDELEAASRRLQGYLAMAALRWQPIKRRTAELTIAEPKLVFNEYQRRIAASLEKDLDTPGALAIVSELEGVLFETLLAEEQVGAFEEFLGFLDEALGLELSRSQDISIDQKELIAAREDARKNQDWARADELRRRLSKQGIEINDTSSGPIWSKTA